MPEDHGAPAGTSANPTEAPESGQGFDFERSYNEIRPEYTRATQELAAAREGLSEYEQLFAALRDPDPEVQAAALDALGLEPAEDTGPQARPDEEWDDPLEGQVKELEATVAELRAARELEAQSAAEAEIIELRDTFIEEELGAIESFQERKFTEDEEEILGNLAIGLVGPNEVPDVRGAYQRLYGEKGFLETQRSGWIESKSGAAQAPLGRTIPADKRPQNAQERAQYVDERWQQLSNQQ